VIATTSAPGIARIRSPLRARTPKLGQYKGSALALRLFRVRWILLAIAKSKTLNSWEFARKLLMRHARFSLQLGEKPREINVALGTHAPQQDSLSYSITNSRPITNRVRCAESRARSFAEDKAGPGVGAQQLARHLSLGHLVERLAGAVQWNDVIDFDVLERRDRLANIILLVRREVEAADDCMNLLNARRCLGPA
jgi:hypothetical protein